MRRYSFGSLDDALSATNLAYTHKIDEAADKAANPGFPSRYEQRERYYRIHHEEVL